MDNLDKGKLHFITGGARSGKSTFAEKLAVSLRKRVLYIATCEPGDEEMVKRAKLHRERRPPSWETIEEPYDVETVISTYGNRYGIILIDCLTLFVTNHLLKTGLIDDYSREEDKEKEVLQHVENMAKRLLEVDAHGIIVSNEVGMGLVPDNPLGRFYRDVLGKANQIAASMAHEVYFMVSGIPLRIK